MRLVSKRTGLSPHVIRAWERRYGAVKPQRTGTNRRSYSEADVKRLQVLSQLVEAGHSIGLIAGLPFEELIEMAAVERSQMPGGVRRYTGRGPVVPEGVSVLDRSEEAVRNMDADTLRAHLTHASLTMGHIGLIDDLLVPLMARIGILWSQGEIGVAHEHLASAVIRTFLGGLADTMPVAPGSPILVSTTPAGQLHEVGALLAAFTAATVGWEGIYLGPNLPASEISAVVRQQNARAVALSIVYPLDDPVVASELRVLSEGLPGDTVILAGGQGALNYAEALAEIGAVLFRDLPGLRTHLLRG